MNRKYYSQTPLAPLAGIMEGDNILNLTQFLEHSPLSIYSIPPLIFGSKGGYSVFSNTLA